jgi:hypothetical protein
MLLQFIIKNFKTFKDEATISFLASNYDKETLEDSNVFYNEKYNLRILKSAVFLGANASGKTNLFQALGTMKTIVLTSSRETQKNDELDVTPFLLSTETEGEPCEFEVTFIYNDELYRYGFEVNRKRVKAEWLYYRPNKKEIEIFYRDGNEFTTHERLFSKGRTLIKGDFIRDNALMVSVAAQFNDQLSGNVLNWFTETNVISGIYQEEIKGFTMNQIENSDKRERILNLLQSADLGIRDINLKDVDIDSLPDDMPLEIKTSIIEDMKKDNQYFFSDTITIHDKYNENYEKTGSVSFSMEQDESHGTQKFFNLSGPILNTLQNGLTLIVDELDSRLHTNLIIKIISLFSDPEINTKNAQLIFNSHDTRVLSLKKFRKDQIWFIEKNRYGASKLYSLSDFDSNTIRKSASYEEKYLEGRFGAIPYLEAFDSGFKSTDQK